MSHFYSFTAERLDGQMQKFSEYAGKVVLIVNTASQCVFTPQYAGLESLYKKYKDDGLVILGFPCNQFGNQELGDADQIAHTCSINYGVTFPMFAKVDVNGTNAHSVFTWLTSKLPGWFGKSIKWNLTKFLISRDGMPIKRFSPITKPEALEKFIKQELAK